MQVEIVFKIETGKNLKELKEGLMKIVMAIDEVDAGKEQQELTGPDEPVTLADLRELLAVKVREGCTAQIRELLAEFGARALSEVKKEDYLQLKKEAEGLNNGTCKTVTV